MSIAASYLRFEETWDWVVSLVSDGIREGLHGQFTRAISVKRQHDTMATQVHMITEGADIGGFQDFVAE